MHAYEDLIGTPFAYRGRGPDTFDCYGLLIEIYRRQGKTIPDLISPDEGGRITAMFANQLVLWKESKPIAGSAVVIRLPGNMHVGYMLDHFRMIHTWEKSGGVLVEPLDEWKTRIIGFYTYAE